MPTTEVYIMSTEALIKSEETIVSEEESKSTMPEKLPEVSDLPGVGAATAEKLAMAGFDTVMAIAVATPGQLANAAGLGEAAARKTIKAARDMLNMGFVSGDQIRDRRKNLKKITTGAEDFNELLDGGFETGAITELFGEFGSGKSQLAHILAVTCQLEDPDIKAFFIDTENTFRPERIKQIAEANNLDPEKVLKNIMVARAYNSDHQMLLAEKVGEMIDQDQLKARFIVVDSLTAHFRAEFVGRGTLAERQQKLNKHMHTLLRLADTHNVCVMVTNQVMAKPDTFFGDPTQAIGGHVVGHASTFRIYLRKGKKGTRVAKLIDSPNLPEGECVFQITTKGIEDVK
jgi:DNA repair protein RadA